MKTLQIMIIILVIGQLVLTANAGEVKEFKLMASDGAANDCFGSNVHISRDYAIVAAGNDDGRCGSAYIFHYDGADWVEQQKIIASDRTPWDSFGARGVFISEDYAVVGVHFDDTTAGSDAGSVYIFHYNGSSWIEQQRLNPNDAAAGDFFGQPVYMSGNYIIVGACKDDTDAESDVGSAYIFQRTGSTWTQQAKLTASDGAAGDHFGYSVSISGDYAIIGAYWDDNVRNKSGSVYIFHYDGSSWVEQQKLNANDSGYGFGYWVSISGDYAIIGSLYEDTDAGNDAGSAYIFHRTGGTWTQQAKLTASDGAAGDIFGVSVSIDGDYAIVGASDADDNGNMSGSAYIFYRNEGGPDNWDEQFKLTASDATANSRFGFSVSISGDRAIAGAYVKNSFTGTAYIYEFLDIDGDGIYRDVDDEPLVYSTQFSDLALEGTTSGRVLGLDANITIKITDAPDPADGVKVVVSGPAGEQARIKIDGSKGTYKLNPGEYIMTSGSVTLEVLSGSATAEFTIEGNLISVAVASGAKVTFEENIVDDQLQGLTVNVLQGIVTVNDEVIEPGSELALTGVEIDIKPGSYPNSVNLGSQGVVPVAILSSQSFDATQVDPSTVELAGSGVAIRGKGSKLMAHQDDVNGDNRTDLVVQVETENLDMGQFQDGYAKLIGKTYSGDQIFGTDEISIVPIGSAPAKPAEFALEQNYPDPFNPDTWIPYKLARDVEVSIFIHDTRGRLVRTLDLGYQSAGFYISKNKAVYWDGKNEAGEEVSSGIYFYSIQAGEFTATKKMVVTR